MRYRRLAATGPEISELTLGAMGMSGMYGDSDDAESRATLTAAIEAGITMIDTGDFYGMGANELLVRDALAGVDRGAYQLSVKFGALRGPDGEWAGTDCRPEAIRNFLAYSLVRLGTDHLDIYRPARLDPAVPIEESVGALAELVQAGYIRYIGLSEVGAGTLRRAAAVHPIHDVQLEYSLLSRGIEAEILPTARELGIGITAYGALSRGLLSGRWRKPAPGVDLRAHSPRFQGENLARNLALVEALAAVAAELGASSAQVAIAWVLARGTDIVPVIGARTREQLAESLAGAELELTRADLAAIENAIPADGAAGERYPAHLMDVLDSER